MFPFQSQIKHNLLTDHIDKSVRVTSRKYNEGRGILGITGALFYGNDTSFVSADGSNIDSWGNLIVGGVAAASTPGGSGRPTLSAAILNGYKTATHARVGDGQRFTFGTTLGKPANWSIFIVARTTNTAITQTFCGSTDFTGQSKNSWGSIVNRSDWAKKIESGHSDGTKYSLHYTNDDCFVSNTFNIFGATYTNGDNFTRHYLQNVLKATTSYSSAATSSGGTAYEFCIGRSGALPYASFDTRLGGNVAAIFIAEKTLSKGERELVVNTFKARYAL